MKIHRPIIATLSLVALVGIAKADDYGCRVLMCMSNPHGPMAENECRPPIQKFIMGQAKKPKDPQPTCEEAQNTSMQMAMRPYDQCPVGTSTLGQNAEAIQLSPQLYAQLLQQLKPTPNRPWERTVVEMPADTKVMRGIGEGSTNDSRNKVCVGQRLGPISFKVGTDDEAVVMTVDVFDRLTTMAPAATPRVMDIFVDQKLFRSVRF